MCRFVVALIGLPVSAISPSTLTGPADLAAELLTEAGATVEISYTYIPAATGPTVSAGAAEGAEGAGVEAFRDTFFAQNVRWERSRMREAEVARAIRELAGRRPHRGAGRARGN